MAKIPVYDRQGKEVGSYEIDPAELAPKVNRQLMHDAVVMYQANQRQGSARTKSRAEVSGTTKKMYRQKGTGNARAGSRRSGIRRGGGHIKSKRPRDYSYRLPRKAVQAATRMALASKINDDQVVIIDQLAFDQPATGDMARILKALSCDGISVLVTTEAYDANIYKSVRNIKKVSVSPVTELNALSLLSARRVVFTKAALDVAKQKAASQMASAAS